jgi:hypothetical protein
VPGFFINVETGRVATHAQLIDAGEASERDSPALPWHPVQGPSDASTAIYAVLRKRVEGRDRAAWIGTLCIRYGGRQAFLEDRGWEEVGIDEMRRPLGRRSGSAGGEAA